MPESSAHPGSTASSSIGAKGWALLFLMVAASVLFFIDRQALSVLKTTLATEFALSNPDYSLLLTAYMVPYTLGYLVSGQLIDRWGTRRCATLFLAGMALATLGCGAARNFHELLAARVALGLAESGVVPSIMLLITQAYPRERRGFIVTLHQGLQSIGPILTPPLIAALALTHGWRLSFYLPGLLSLVVALAWYWGDRSPLPQKTPSTATRGVWGGGILALRTVLTAPALRGILLARIVTDPCWFFLIYWQAPFLQERGGWTLAEIGRWTWLPPAFAAVGNVAIGLWSDRVLRRRSDPVAARWAALRGLAFLAPCLALVPFAVESKPAVLVLLVLGYFLANCWLTMINVLVTEVAPAGTLATTLGVMSAIGGFASIAFTAFAGVLVDRFGYNALFIAAACLHPIGVVLLHRFGPRSAASDTLR